MSSYFLKLKVLEKCSLTKLEKKMKQTGGPLLSLKFKKVRGAKMKCTMSAHFMKNVNEHLCHRGFHISYECICICGCACESMCFICLIFAVGILISNIHASVICYAYSHLFQLKTFHMHNAHLHMIDEKIFVK